jgi:hypothetical protein
MRRMAQTARDDQRGLVSIVVTMIMMVIMSLIVIGFARISRRELRQGLDRQLVSQANYAAESGINDAQDYLRDGGGLSASAATTCNSYTSPGNGLPKSQEIGDPSIVTSCVLVDSTTQELIYDNVGTDSEVVFPLRSADGNPINNIFISWEGGNNTDYNAAQCQTNAVQPQDGLVPATGSTRWTCPVGGLRIDLLPVNVTGNYSRGVLLLSTTGALLMPRPNAVVPTRSLANGVQSMAGCSTATTPKTCGVNLSVNGRSEYYVRIRPIYRSADLYIQARRGGNPVELVGAQALIDSTGRASDVLKRLVVRVPTCPSGLECGKRPANAALQLADTLCKRYGVIPPSTINVESSNPDAACQLP